MPSPARDIIRSRRHDCKDGCFTAGASRCTAEHKPWEGRSDKEWLPPTVLRPQGRLDGRTSRNLGQDLLKRIEAGDHLLVLDSSKITFISSAGLHAILSAAKRGKSVGGRLAICSPTKPVKEIFDVTGCMTLLDIFSTYDAAAAHLSMK